MSIGRSCCSQFVILSALIDSNLDLHNGLVIVILFQVVAVDLAEELLAWKLKLRFDCFTFRCPVFVVDGQHHKLLDRCFELSL